MRYIGLDCHKKFDHATMIDTETGEIKAKRLLHFKDEFAEFIGEKRDTKLVMESCWNWCKTYELVKDLVEEVTLAHPLRLRAVAAAKIKTDAIDSRTLAELLMADFVPQVHLREADNRIKQRVIRHRAFLIAMRTRVKCRIHELVDSQLLSREVMEAKPLNLFSKKGMKWLSSLELAKKEDRKMFESYIKILAAINQEIAYSNSMVKEIYEKDENAQLLATIPGIGITLATLISTEIDGIDRFKSSSRLCSYAGLVPSTLSSGGKTYHGRLVPEGNRWLRWGLIEAVVPASYADAEIRRELDALRKIKRGNVAKTIMARRLLKIVYHVLKEHRAYVMDYSTVNKPSRLVFALANPHK
jgi:transposase